MSSPPSPTKRSVSFRQGLFRIRSKSRPTPEPIEETAAGFPFFVRTATPYAVPEPGWCAGQFSVETDESTMSPTRLQAVRNFREAVSNLQTHVPKDCQQLQIPEGIRLQHLERVDKVDEAVQDLQSDLDKHVRAHVELRATESRPQIVNDFVRNWFLASFPFVITVRLRRGSLI